eukprot:1149901-Pelagomonas_calceolata.AAC.6
MKLHARTYARTSTHTYEAHTTTTQAQPFSPATGFDLSFQLLGLPHNSPEHKRQPTNRGNEGVKAASTFHLNNAAAQKGMLGLPHNSPEHKRQPQPTEVQRDFDT